MRTSRPITVTLGNQQDAVDRRVASGEYESASEVIRAGLRALDREEAALTRIMREKIRQALESDGEDIPAEQVFADLRAQQARLEAAAKNGK